jgi:predicted transcriptional regulator
VLHYPKLLENVFNLRYKSGANHKKFPINSISKDYTNFLIDFIERKSVNNKLLNLLPNLEQMHFKNLLRESVLSNEFKVKTNADSEEKNDHERFEILQGQIIAGQNNPKVINEFKDIIQKFSQTGKLTKMQVKNAMNVLKNVSK